MTQMSFQILFALALVALAEPEPWRRYGGSYIGRSRGIYNGGYRNRGYNTGYRRSYNVGYNRGGYSNYGRWRRDAESEAEPEAEAEADPFYYYPSIYRYNGYYATPAFGYPVR